MILHLVILNLTFALNIPLSYFFHHLLDIDLHNCQVANYSSKSLHLSNLRHIFYINIDLPHLLQPVKILKVSHFFLHKIFNYKRGLFNQDIISFVHYLLRMLYSNSKILIYIYLTNT